MLHDNTEKLWQRDASRTRIALKIRESTLPCTQPGRARLAITECTNRFTHLPFAQPSKSFAQTTHHQFKRQQSFAELMAFDRCARSRWRQSHQSKTDEPVLRFVRPVNLARSIAWSTWVRQDDVLREIPEMLSLNRSTFVR